MTVISSHFCKETLVRALHAEDIAKAVRLIRLQRSGWWHLDTEIGLTEKLWLNPKLDTRISFFVLLCPTLSCFVLLRHPQGTPPEIWNGLDWRAPNIGFFWPFLTIFGFRIFLWTFWIFFGFFGYILDFFRIFLDFWIFWILWIFKDFCWIFFFFFFFFQSY